MEIWNNTIKSGRHIGKKAYYTQILFKFFRVNQAFQSSVFDVKKRKQAKVFHLQLLF